MASEPENLTHRMLRDMREILDDHTKRLERLDKRTAETHESVITALGFAAHANVQYETVDRRLDDLALASKRWSTHDERVAPRSNPPPSLRGA